MDSLSAQSRWYLLCEVLLVAGRGEVVRPPPVLTRREGEEEEEEGGERRENLAGRGHQLLEGGTVDHTPVNLELSERIVNL